MIIDAVGCLHGHYPELEGGDLLIVTGDLTARDEPAEYERFFDWLAIQSYKKKVFIAGNHDMAFLESNPPCVPKHCDATYLCDSGTEFEGIKIFGSPWSLTFPEINPKCTAFTGDEELLAEKFALIPDDIDILVTHGPPFRVLDKTCRGQHVGSEALSIHSEARVRPRLHVFSHIHEARGSIAYHYPNRPSLFFVNCSHVNERYQPVNKPIRVIL
jgi:Icc-related predicted phosphoesterase